MNDDDLRALVALAAVDALEPDEEQALRDALADRPDLAAELEDLRVAAATMAEAVAETPPPSVRAGVLAAIAAEVEAGAGAPTALPAEPGPPGPPRQPSPPSPPTVVPLAPRRRRRLVLLAAAAAVVVASAAVATRVLDDSSADEIAAVLDDPDAVEVGLSGEIGELTVVYSGDDRRAVMQGDDIAGLDDDKVYELWTLPPGGDAIPVGTFRPDGDGVVEVLMDDVDLDLDASLAITVEPSGGSDAPTSPPVAQSA